MKQFLMLVLVFIAPIGVLADYLCREETNAPFLRTVLRVFPEVDWAPIQLSALQCKLFGTNPPIYGLHLNLNPFDGQKYVYGVNIGSIYSYVEDSNGILLSIGMNAYETNYGMSIAGIANWGAGDGICDIAMVNFSWAKILQLGILNFCFSSQDFPGTRVQLGGFNANQGESIFQGGIWNASNENVFALGIVNGAARNIIALGYCVGYSQRFEEKYISIWSGQLQRWSDNQQ